MSGKRSFESLLSAFGTPATLQSEINLQPEFAKLALHVKDQGRRPSCAIFAVVSALEFQNAGITGQPEKFSEEYLIWATRKTLARPPGPVPALGDGDEGANVADFSDAGFALQEVVAGLRAYGIPLDDDMPYTWGRRMDTISEPPSALIDRARDRRQVHIYNLPGRDTRTAINNIVHALNAHIPVPIGLGWPYERTIRAGILNAQIAVPGYSHAVTLVGYRCPSGRIEDAIFIFKNSYGPRWGQGGYGTVSAHYLSRYLQSAIVLEVGG